MILFSRLSDEEFQSPSQMYFSRSIHTCNSIHKCYCKEGPGREDSYGMHALPSFLLQEIGQWYN